MLNAIQSFIEQMASMGLSIFATFAKIVFLIFGSLVITSGCLFGKYIVRKSTSKRGW